MDYESKPKIFPFFPDNFFTGFVPYLTQRDMGRTIFLGTLQLENVPVTFHRYNDSMPLDYSKRCEECRVV